MVTDWRRPLVGLFTGALVCAAPALADRPATSDERSAVATALGLSVECTRARVSTVDEAWAVFTGRVREACQQGDGWIALLRQQDDSFAVHSQGAWDNPPCPALQEGPPMRVALDLGLCHRPRTYLLCRRSARVAERVPRERPRRCDTLGPNDALASGANLVKVRWRTWGGRVARGRGIERGYHLPLAHIPVRVKAYRKRKVCGGDYLYTRLKATSRYGTTTVRQPARCGD